MHRCSRCSRSLPVHSGALSGSQRSTSKLILRDPSSELDGWNYWWMGGFLVDEWIMNGWMDGWMDGSWMAGRMDGRMDGWWRYNNDNFWKTCLAARSEMASLWRSAYSLKPFLRHSSLSFRWFYLVVMGLGPPLRLSIDSIALLRGPMQILAMNEWVNELNSFWGHVNVVSCHLKNVCIVLVQVWAPTIGLYL